MARYDELAYNPLSNSHELFFANALTSLGDLIDRMLDGFGGVPSDETETRAVIEALREPVALAVGHYFGSYPAWYEAKPSTKAESESEPEPKRRGIQFKRAQ